MPGHSGLCARQDDAARRRDRQKVVREECSRHPLRHCLFSRYPYCEQVRRLSCSALRSRAVHFEVCVPMPCRQRRKGRAGMSVTNTTEVAPVRASAMIPGAREPGSLTRFAVRPEMSQPIVDVTIDAATLAERRREGGGAARKRHPARVLPLTALMRRIRAMWRIRRTPPPLVSVREPVAVEPGR